MWLVVAEQADGKLQCLGSPGLFFDFLIVPVSRLKEMCLPWVCSWVGDVGHYRPLGELS